MSSGPVLGSAWGTLDELGASAFTAVTRGFLHPLLRLKSSLWPLSRPSFVARHDETLTMMKIYPYVRHGVSGWDPGPSWGGTSPSAG